MVIEHTREIAALWESTKSSHKRIDNNERMIAGIHELAKSVSAMATEIKALTNRVDKSIERTEEGLKEQGARIGNMEKIINQIERNEKELQRQAERLAAVEKAPADKWSKFVWLIVSAVVAAIMAYIIGNFYWG